MDDDDEKSEEHDEDVEGRKMRWRTRPLMKGMSKERRVEKGTNYDIIGFGTCALCFSFLASSRVFIDSDVQPTRDYLTWLGSNSEVASRVNPDVVTKAEPATIGTLLSFMRQEGEKVAWFECTATIDDVVHGSAWYYIACCGGMTKATKGPTTLMCKKCGKADVAGVAEYLTKISVYDTNDQATFANAVVGDDHVVPVPQALIDTIGQTHMFVIKISDYNFTGKSKDLTFTKVLRPQTPEPEVNVAENLVVPSADEALQGDNPEESADERVKRSSDMVETEEAKLARCG
ncbi:unnamed protein product [Eruca vesicaria subsp. sativa]|uniref:Replication factor A C-terminal domain-containing protein n=1 Tax=Eruca vesicaria subsp. sativa TaxID=29727 RepID=A0ABC8LGC2_ERUVS|nr:unnamed protein product [Eruca vesicaria subsp. sativa]